MKVLMVEDDEALCRAVGAHLRREGYACTFAHDGETGCYYALQNAFDLVLLDRLLPGMDGLAVLAAMRRGGVKTPVLLLTALDAVGDRVAGLDAGADDYLAKPFAVEELLARVRALCRRPALVSPGGALAAGDLSLDSAGRRLAGPCGESALSKTEAELLALFLQNMNQVLPRELLYLRVWGPDSDAQEQCVDNYVHFLRRRLKSIGSGCAIETVRSVGYRLAVGT